MGRKQYPSITITGIPWHNNRLIPTPPHPPSPPSPHIFLSSPPSSFFSLSIKEHSSSRAPLSSSLRVCPCDPPQRQSSLRIDSLWYPKPMEPSCQDTRHRRHSWAPGTRQLLPNNKDKNGRHSAGRCSPNLPLRPELVTLSQLLPACLLRPQRIGSNFGMRAVD